MRYKKAYMDDTRRNFHADDYEDSGSDTEIRSDFEPQWSQDDTQRPSRPHSESSLFLESRRESRQRDAMDRDGLGREMMGRELVGRNVAEQASELRRREGQLRAHRRRMEASRQALRSHQDAAATAAALVVDHHDRAEALASAIHARADEIEAMEHGQKRSQMLTEYNDMVAKHQAVSQKLDEAQAAHALAEQTRFTCELEMNKLANLEKKLAQEEQETLNERKILSQYRKDTELDKLRKVELELAERHREQMEREREMEKATLRTMEETRKARSLAQERIRVRLENSKAKAEQDQREKEEDVQKRIGALLSLKQNADSALSELKSANERRSQKRKIQNEARLQETVTLLSQGLNPYEHFRHMEQKRQKELNRIAVMSEKRREEVRRVVAEDVTQYNKAKKLQLEEQIRQEKLHSPRNTNQSNKERDIDESNTERDDRQDSFEERASSATTRRSELTTPDGEGSLMTREPSRKRFTLNLPRVASRRSSNELNVLQSALSLASLASSVLPSTRSSTRDGGDGYGDTSRSMSRRDTSDMTGRMSAEYTGELRTANKPPRQKPRSVLEQKMMERTMQSLKNNIVKKQVVMNKEFEGKSFITKPNILVFDDFEIGSSYTKKVTVTNVSLSFNTFKVLELPARVSDFFKIAYEPPGRLSAGTGVPIDVTFTPVLLTPLSEKLVILAETGQFEIPIECTPKQCKVSLSTNQIEFENISLGETQVRSIKIINNGGLASSIDLSFEPETCLLDNNSESIIDQDGNTRPVASTVQSSFVFNTIPNVIAAYSTLSLDITFTPKVLGQHSISVLVFHKGPDNSPMETRLSLTGNVSDVPIYLSSREIDFHVCYCGQLYREVLVLHNRGKTALKAIVTIPNILKKFVEFVPRVAFVQAHSSLSVQVKLKPTIDLLHSSIVDLMCSSSPTPTIDLMNIIHDDKQMIDGEVENITPSSIPSTSSNYQPSCTISMAVTVEVASQCSPVWFQLKALVTNPILSILPSSFDFGECSTNESVSIPFTVRNHSVASVKYGFVHLPKEIQIVPGDGFGTLLPLEEMSLLATFNPVTATHHNFSLTAKTDQGRVFTIPCSGTGVKPALQFSPSIISLPPTSLGDMNTASVFLENISKVPQMFEICVPDDCPFLRINPVVQTIAAGSRAHIKIDFEPGLSHAEITTEASKPPEQEVKQIDQPSKALKTRSQSRKSMTSNRAIPETPNSASSETRAELTQRGGSKNTVEKKTRKKKGSSNINLLDLAVPAPLSPRGDNNIAIQSVQPIQVVRTQPQQLPEGKPLTWKIPCFSKPAKTSTSLRDTQQATIGDQSPVVVYLEISAIVAPPTLVRVLDPSERPTNQSAWAANPPIDFGQVPVAQTLYGTMTVLNAVRPMLPNQSQVLQIQYKPDTHGMHVESIELTVGKHHRLVVPVHGQGVEPKLSIEPADEVLDLGYTIAKDASKKEIKLVNASQFNVGYQIQLLRTGPKNLNGVNPFCVIPSEGDVPVGGEKIVTIIFEPDHENYSFQDVMQIQVKSENSKRTIILKGSCTGTRGVYLQEYGNLDYTSKPSTFDISPESPLGLSDVIKPGYCGCVPRGSLTLHFTSNDSPFASSPSTNSIIRSLVFGNAKIKREKGVLGEVILEPLSPQALKDGFSVDVSRLSIEPDSTKTITFKFDPTATSTHLGIKKFLSSKPNPTISLVENLMNATAVETSVKCTLKGGYSGADKEGTSFILTLVGHCKVKTR